MASTTDLLERDAAHRQAAIDPERSFIIEAPAGAGKTELLTQRFLALLGRVQEPEEIVALTFTNKAAAEMRDRVMQSLLKAASGQAPDEPHKLITFELGRRALERDAARQWHLLAHPGRLQITTLDALCGRLARQMPLLSRLGSQPGVATDPEPHYLQAASDTLSLLGSAQGIADVLERVLDRFDNDTQRLQKQLVAMLAQRDQWLRHSHSRIDLAVAEGAIRDLIAEELKQVMVCLPLERQLTLMPAARHAAANVLTAQACGEPLEGWQGLAPLEGWTQPLQGQPEELPLWRALPLLLLTQAGAVRARLPSDPGLHTPEGKALADAAKPVMQALKAENAGPLLQKLARLPDPAYSDEECGFIEDLMAVLKVATAQLWLGFQRAREVDFTAMAQNALLALGTSDAPTDLQLQLDHRIQHLLVDEFQDTSPTQVALLERLTAGWQPDSGRSLFLVGDPMQSIYKFRKADVGLFLNIRQRGLGGWPLQALHLYRNNRSHEAVVEWVNQTFPGVFASSDNHHRGAVRFAPAAATRGDHPGSRVQWHPLIDTTAPDDEDDAADTLPELEARQVIEIIRSCREQNPDGTMAVLVRARTHLEALVSLLRAQDPPLPFQAVEIEPLADRQVIQDLTSLTHALHHLADRTHWLAILRAPWCGLTLADLHVLAAEDHRRPIWSLMHEPERLQGLSDDGQQRLLHVRQVMADAYTHRGIQRPSRWVEGIWQALGGPLCLRAASDLTDARAFFDALERCESHGSLLLSQLPRELEKLYAAPDPQATSQLQLMTIHKSKGLEFDTVILPGLHRKAAQTDRPLLLWDQVLDEDGVERLVVAAQPAPSRPVEGESPAPSKYGLLHQLETERTLNEAQRLLYVAVTRSKTQLHLLGSAKPDSKQADALKPPARDSLLSLLWHVAEREFLAALDGASPPGAPNSGAPSATRTPLSEFRHQLARLAQPQTPAALRVPDDLRSQAQSSQPDTHRSLASKDDALGVEARWAADLGTLVHRYLEIMATEGLDHWPESRILSLESAMQTWLESQDHPIDQARRGAQEVVRQLQITRRSQAGQWLLQAHEQAASEWAVSDANANHVIDRTFVADGMRWIVDYKTTRDAQATAEAHRAQLERYRDCFGQTHPIQLAVFFTDRGELALLSDTRPIRP